MSEQFEGLTRGATNGGDEIFSTFVEFSRALFPFSVSTRPGGVDTVDVNKLHHHVSTSYIIYLFFVNYKLNFQFKEAINQSFPIIVYRSLEHLHHHALILKVN